MLARRLLPTALALAVLALAAAGCGAGDKAKTPDGAVLDRDALAQDLTTRLSDAAGGKSPKVACPADLPVTVGLTVRCTATLGGKRFGVTVTVTGSNGGTAEYSVAVDKTAQQ